MDKTHRLLLRENKIDCIIHFALTLIELDDLLLVPGTKKLLLSLVAFIYDFAADNSFFIPVIDNNCVRDISDNSDKLFFF